MGSSESNISQYQNNPKYNLDDFKFVQQLNNVRYGEVKVVQHMKTGNKYAIKTLLYQNESEFQEAYQHAQQKQKSLQIPSIVNIMDIKTEVSKYFCSNSYKIVIIYEFYNNSLERLIKMNRKQNTLFSEQEIYYLIDCVLSALMCMHYKKYSHSDIRSKTIVVTPDGLYKITDMNYLHNQQPTPLKQTILGSTTSNKMYLSPEKLHAIKTKQQEQNKIFNRNFIYQHYQLRDLHKLQEYLDEWQKGDVFSLGLVALQMATLSNIVTEVIDFENFEIKKKNIQKLLDVVKKRYSQNLYSLISSMLEYQYTKRQDFYKLAELLIPQTQQESFLQQSKSQIKQDQLNQLDDSDSQETITQISSPISTIIEPQNKEKQEDNMIFKFDEQSLNQQTVSAETWKVTREKINQMMQNNQNFGIFNNNKVRQPYINLEQSDSLDQFQFKIQRDSSLKINNQQKTPYLNFKSNNQTKNYQINSHRICLDESPLIKRKGNDKDNQTERNSGNKENVKSHKTKSQSILLSELQKLDLQVNDVLKQTQTIKNQFKQYIYISNEYLLLFYFI